MRIYGYAVVHVGTSEMFSRTVATFSRSRGLYQVPNLVPSYRGFCSKSPLSTSSRVLDAVREFIDLRTLELEQYQAVDPSDKEEVEKIVSQLKAAKPTEHTSWSELGFDGLDEVEVVLAIESKLGLTLPDDEFHSIHSIADAVKVCDKYLPRAG
jgi:acyl carrier protein